MQGVTALMIEKSAMLLRIKPPFAVPAKEAIAPSMSLASRTPIGLISTPSDGALIG
jgi:hypothetical protein